MFLHVGTAGCVCWDSCRLPRRVIFALACSPQSPQVADLQSHHAPLRHRTNGTGGCPLLLPRILCEIFHLEQDEDDGEGSGSASALGEVLRFCSKMVSQCRFLLPGRARVVLLSWSARAAGACSTTLPRKAGGSLLTVFRFGMSRYVT